jgi:hypothetical protein
MVTRCGPDQAGEGFRQGREYRCTRLKLLQQVFLVGLDLGGEFRRHDSSRGTGVRLSFLHAQSHPAPLQFSEKLTRYHVNASISETAWTSASRTEASSATEGVAWRRGQRLGTSVL